MTEPVNIFEQENRNLKQQLEAGKTTVEGMLAQLDAHKQMINDTLAQNLQLRTNLILVQKMYQKLDAEFKNVQAQVEELKKELELAKSTPTQADAA